MSKVLKIKLSNKWFTVVEQSPELTMYLRDHPDNYYGDGIKINSCRIVEIVNSFQGGLCNIFLQGSSSKVNDKYNTYKIEDIPKIIKALEDLCNSTETELSIEFVKGVLKIT